MTDQVCRTCAGEGGLSGPCPECGALPAVAVMSAPDEVASEMQQVTTGRPRPLVLGIVVVLVGLVVGSVVWDLVRSGDEADAGSEPEAAAETSTTTTTTRPRAVPPPASGNGDDEVLTFPPVEGFEDQWLLIVDPQTSVVQQVPLAGGDVITIAEPTRSDGGHYYPNVLHLTDDAIIGSGGSVSLIDHSYTPYFRFDGRHVIRPVGVTDTGTVVFDGEILSEGTSTGELIRYLDLGDIAMDGSFVAVRGREVLHSGIHGVHRLDIDSGRAVRVYDGMAIGVGTNVLVGRSCSGWQQCSVDVVDMGDGSIRSTLSHDVDQHLHLFGFAAGAPIAPDDTRFIAVSGDQVRMFDLESGQLLGRFDLPEFDHDVGYVETQILWSSNSRAALVLRAPNWPNDGGFVAWIDRDLIGSRFLEDHQQLVASSPSSRADGRGFLLSGRPFDPVPVP